MNDEILKFRTKLFHVGILKQPTKRARMNGGQPVTEQQVACKENLPKGGASAVHFVAASLVWLIAEMAS